MKRIAILLFVLLNLSTPSYAAERITLQNGGGTEIGTAANPIIATLSGAFSGSTVTASSLTATRVVFAGVAGLLSDDSDMTFATDTLTITKIAATILSGVATLAENSAIALDPAGSAATTSTGITVSGTAGATLAYGDLIYLDPTDSRWELVDANAAAAADGDARGIIGMCVLAAAADASPTTILLSGIIRSDATFPALTINAPVYPSETAGDIVVTKPTTTDAVVRPVGTAITADEIYFDPDFTYYTAV